MPESTLSLSITDLKAEIGHFLGYGRGAEVYGETAWTTPQTNNIVAALKSGLSQVYTPPPLNEREASHNWSWLRPFTTLNILANTSATNLPDDFGGFEGPIYLTGDNARRHWSIPVTNEGKVQHHLAAYPDTTGPPQMAAESFIKGTTLAEGSRSQLIVWPKSDANYTLKVEYKYLPDALTGLLPYPPGGSEHAELFKASCLACAELQFDDTLQARRMHFMTMLTASVHADRKRKGQKLGYNGDWSGGNGGWRGLDRTSYGNDVTYNGQPL